MWRLEEQDRMGIQDTSDGGGGWWVGAVGELDGRWPKLNSRVGKKWLARDERGQIRGRRAKVGRGREMAKGRCVGASHWFFIASRWRGEMKGLAQWPSDFTHPCFITFRLISSFVLFFVFHLVSCHPTLITGIWNNDMYRLQLFTLKYNYSLNKLYPRQSRYFPRGSLVWLTSFMMSPSGDAPWPPNLFTLLPDCKKKLKMPLLPCIFINRLNIRQTVILTYALAINFSAGIKQERRKKTLFITATLLLK